MSEIAKKAALIVVIVVAVAFVASSSKSLFVGERMIVENRMDAPPGHKSEKERALEARAKSGEPNPEPFKEREVDLGK